MKGSNGIFARDIKVLHAENTCSVMSLSLLQAFKQDFVKNKGFF
jgi:hypothetical protein